MRHIVQKVVPGMFVWAAVMLLSGCQEMVEKPQVHVVSLQYANITGSTQTIGVRLSVRNPNSFAIPIQSGAADVTIDGYPFAQGAIGHITLPANQSVRLTIPIKTNTDTLKMLEPELPGILLAGKVRYLVSGHVLVHDGVTLSCPFTYKGTLTFGELQKIVSDAISDSLPNLKG
jgi:LEA14-like dessication related protein